jgi:hypothetical protein
MGFNAQRVITPAGRLLKRSADAWSPEKLRRFP